MSDASPAPDEGLAIGSVVDGRYRIDGVLGSGGMGRVYRGEHTGIGRAVAIKVLHANLGSNREAVTRFQREALASGRLDHPNIVAVSDFGELPDGSAYLVMEALDGEALGARLERGRLPWRDALAVLRGVMLGLGHAHDRGVIHRDIKPDNVFLAKKDGELVVKVLDFGIAKLFAGAADDPATTRAGITIGTPAYLSPEQAVGGEITPQTDLYSATVVLFEMLTGRAPFEAADPLQMLGAHAAGVPPKLREVAPDLDVPDGTEQLVARGLAKRHVERPASAAAYVADLDALTGPPPPTGVRGSQPVAVVPPPPDLDTSQSETRPLLAIPDAPPPPPGETSTVLGQAPTVSLTPLPMAARAVTLAQAARDPVPKSWLVIGGAVLGGAVLLAIVLALASGGGSKSGDVATSAAPSDATLAVVPDAHAAKPAAKPDAGAPKPVDAAVTEPPPPPIDAEHEKTYRALIKQLETGRGCADRRVAAIKLGVLGDARAIPALEAARVKPFGRRNENANACLTADANAAIKKLEPT